MKKNLTTIVIVIATLVFLSVGCNMFKQSVVTEKSDPKETVTNAFKKLKEVKFYTAKQPFKDMTFSYAYVAPNKFRSEQEIKSIPINRIVIGDDDYFNVSKTEPYTKTNKPISSRTENWNFPNPDNEIFSKIDKIENVKFMKKESFEGKDGLMYEVGVPGMIATMVLVSTETGLPIQVKTASSEGLLVITNYDYSTEPKIEAPTNVK